LMRRLFGRGNTPQPPERYDPWDRLVAEARTTVSRAAALAAPDLADPGCNSVSLRGKDASSMVESFLSELTRQLRELCAPYDYRQGLPDLILCCH
jgi:hypothetical protein